MKFLGIDPGIRGAIAVVMTNNDTAPILIDVIDIPVIGTGAKERIDVAAIRDFVVRHKPDHAVIERAQVMPRQGSSSGFKYGRAVGAIEAAITLSAIPVEIVEPSVWKRLFKLPGKDKEAARQCALLAFPGRTPCSRARRTTAALKRPGSRLQVTSAGSTATATSRAT
jgi:crossover junction endodeoxyribonuclease RuvC